MEPLPPLNALRIFEVVGRVSSISAAAQELCVTPAAVSRQIRVLEDHLRTRLFYRQHRRIAFTPAGREYHLEVSRHIAGLRRATLNVHQAARSRIFNLRAPHTIAMRWLLPRLASLHAAHPELEVRLHTSANPPDFEREDLDAAIVINHGHAPGLVQHKIMENEIAPVCTPEMAARLQQPGQLLGETLLHTHARPDDWQMWFLHAGQPMPGTSRDMRFESSALAYEAALAGFGIAIGQKSLITQELDDGRLVAPFGPWVNLGSFSYYFVMPQEIYLRNTPEATVLRQWIASISLPAQPDTQQGR
ncbi:LysR substrate-binding domain-containing protein [Bordetella sp. BOR01]|uniref:LysR substrate-binding domain-containing protein n=1 Tax=Bordetella sp. BOR01 TaxID=2854779 RepID=UPI001C4442AC|nr:LysR substrate-binding domain-containing protein [Bordetella sp. BOR01]MBV7486692.1 LysR family transcriptional regulator [Bordetella sp. BOR01]